MYLDIKTKLIILAKLVKSKFQIFHTRIRHLVVITIGQQPFGRFENFFCRLISMADTIDKSLN